MSLEHSPSRAQKTANAVISDRSCTIAGFSRQSGCRAPCSTGVGRGTGSRVLQVGVTPYHPPSAARMAGAARSRRWRGRPNRNQNLKNKRRPLRGTAVFCVLADMAALIKPCTVEAYIDVVQLRSQHVVALNSFLSVQVPA